MPTPAASVSFCLVLCSALFILPACAETAPAEEPAPDPSAGFDALLRQHVDEAGLVDYQALREAPAALESYVAYLADVDLESGTDAEKLALLINAYNAFTLQLIVEHPGIASIFDIPEDQRWDHVRWNLGGTDYSLNQIEHEIIRPVFDEPRIHWVLVCAALDCPPLRPQIYTAQQLDEQLEAQTEWVHASPKHVRYDASTNVLSLTPLYEWYGEDFGPGDKTQAVLKYVAGYVPGVAQALSEGRTPRIQWLNYDWALNVQPGRG